MKKLASLLVLGLVAAALVACGDDDDEVTVPTDTVTEETANGEEEAGGGAQGGGSSVEFEAPAEGGLEYTTDEASAKAGKVTIEFNNPQSIPHDVAIESADGELVGKTDVITEAEDSATVNLEEGEYTFYCTVPGHREAGMEGTLNIE